jgi:broad specificity phosphatase PhoE
MIQDTIRQIEERLRTSENISPETRNELLTLLAKLHTEARDLPPREPAEASSGPESKPEEESVQDTVEQLRRSVEEFEESHPKVVHLVNHLANTLSGLGI